MGEGSHESTKLRTFTIVVNVILTVLYLGE